MASTNQRPQPAEFPLHHADGLLTRVARWFRSEEREPRRTPKPHDGWFD